ncbi:CoA transferase subunit A [Sporolactobacillus spathodeae]|uniref:3-oxoacid CoA-transferase subunit A n=1 Tax=Sporolactobacillus spathodeae TaxID=1465502 RepID=A0ABS2QBB9_9BACL|nr:CoA transferase subunit A [Sporolactobacillus spathodeae]MBM7658921.1 3-oxoacid CoA-transferase subunit A [Sporolactobacillus spathodeae]
MNKIIEPSSAVDKIFSGQTLMVGGFGLVGAPLTLIEELAKRDVNQLTILSNNLGEPGQGLGLLLRQRQVKKAVGSYFTSNWEVGEAYNQGFLEIELMPQGTFAESIRAGGAGIGGFYTKTGVGTELGERKEVRVIHGEKYLFEPSWRADVALIKAYQADQMGNLTYHKTARNFNPVMATAADYVIAEVDEIVACGQLPPENIVTPHLFVDAIVQSRRMLTREGVVDR